MSDVGPFMVTAHNQQQAEYLIRSRAEQRGVAVSHIDVSPGGSGTWLVTVTVVGEETAEAARLGDDTQVLHLDFHQSRPGPAAG
jgi:hypothetical protein